MGLLDLTVGQSKRDTPVQTLSRIFDKAVGGCTLFGQHNCRYLHLRRAEPHAQQRDRSKEVTNSGCDTLGNLALATGRNERVDYK